MAKLSVKDIQTLARQIVRDNPGGIRYTNLLRAIADAHPETPVSTIHGSIWTLAAKFPQEIVKPSRGLFMPATLGAEPPRPEVVVTLPNVSPKVKEEDLYEPFADWLKNELEEVTDAVGLGGAGLQKKWGTPDVVGVYRPRASDRIKFDPEIVAAEIKLSPQQPVEAFGQAVCYRLFAAKSYVVMPSSISAMDYGRLEALCMLFGIGLVLFDVDANEPDFQIRVRAQRFSPDMFYVNEFVEGLHRLDLDIFNTLFG